MIKDEYKNIIAFHPGYYLVDILEELEMTQEDFAKRLGISGKTVSLLLNGQTPLTNDLAMRVSSMLGISVDTLLNLQQTYDKKVIEINNAKELDAQIEVINEIDYNYFTRNGILPIAKTIREKVDNLCTFLKVSNLQILRSRDLLASFRTTVTDVTDKHIINANVWLQTAINQGKEMAVAEFDEKKLKAFIPEIRSMTLQDPNVFLPRLQEIFSSCGVAFVLLPVLKNCGINGVVKWFDDRVVLAINDRFKCADTFWFSLFHEIKHVFQKKKTKTIVSIEKSLDGILDLDVSYELEADQYASDTLIPKVAYNSYFGRRSSYISKKEVRSFAQQIGIHPGIVVGRLQHDGKVAHSNMNDMKDKYTIIVRPD